MNKKKFAIIFGAIVVAAVAAAVIWYFFGDGRHDSKDRVYVEKVSVIMGTATGAQTAIPVWYNHRNRSRSMQIPIVL